VSITGKVQRKVTVGRLLRHRHLSSSRTATPAACLRRLHLLVPSSRNHAASSLRLPHQGMFIFYETYYNVVIDGCFRFQLLLIGDSGTISPLISETTVSSLDYFQASASHACYSGSATMHGRPRSSPPLASTSRFVLSSLTASASSCK
jgi:hypothetical protein